MAERVFERIIGIDYSGGDTPLKRLRNSGLAVYCADGDAPPYRVLPTYERARNWHRKELAEWLVDLLKKESKPTLVGIDHAFSFPIDYFKKHGLREGDWDHFLTDFREYWPTHKDKAWVSTIRDTEKAKKRYGDSKWLRLTDKVAGGAKSVFHFGAQGTVASSTHAGLPWLWHIREELRKSEATVHFWPFDGWDNWKGKSVVAEVYPALWKGRFDPPNNSDHQHDAYSVAGWLSYADRNGLLDQYFKPALSPEECKRAKTEGWIFGVLGFIRLGVGADVRATDLL